jgi:hypothetical protein
MNLRVKARGDGYENKGREREKGKERNRYR